MLLFIEALLGGDGEVAVLQVHLDILLLKAGQLDGHLIAVLRFPHIGLHQVLGVLAVELPVHIEPVPVKVVLPKIIQQVLSENTGQHSQHFLS